MKSGKSRFEFQLDKMEVLFKQAKEEENTGLWLFLHDLRTPVFMLEGLCKLYAALIDKNIFLKLKEKFKTLEDVLGAVDYYSAFAKEFTAGGNIPSSFIESLESKTNKQILRLNEILKKDDWLNGKGIRHIKDDLEQVYWLKDEKEIVQINTFYQEEIVKIQDFVQDTGFVFDNVEADIHELRRKIRWLSIYPQALQGAIQLKPSKPPTKDLSTYLTEKVISSPYNQLPAAKPGASILYLDKNYFLALSWMIAELGSIKDFGLRIKVLKDVIQEKKLLNDTNSLVEVYKLLGDDYPHTEALLKRASTVSKKYFEEKYLSKLVVE